MTETAGVRVQLSQSGVRGPFPSLALRVGGGSLQKKEFGRPLASGSQLETIWVKELLFCLK
jgi:hypothetical protein